MIKEVIDDRFPSEVRYNVLRWMLRVLVASAILEFFILRIFMRMGTIFPKSEIAETIYTVLVFHFGLTSFNFVFLLSMISLGLTAVILTQGKKPISVISLLLLALLATSVALISDLNSSVSVIYYAISTLIIASSLVISIRGKMVQAPIVLLVVAEYSCSYYYMIASSATLSSFNLPYVPEIFSFGEILALITPSIAFLTLRPRWDIKNVVFASIPVILFLLVARSPLLAPIMTWAVFFTLHLPAPFYAISLWFTSYVLIDLLRHRSVTAFSFLFLILAGRMLNTIYLNQLALLGVLMLIQPLRRSKEANYDD